ncbi:MAG: RNA polymerase sigma factor [Myxococcales bacterium]
MRSKNNNKGKTAREREEIAELYRLYAPAIHRRCLRILGDHEAGGDATHEVFMRLIGNLAKLQNRDRAVRWIFRVSVNHCLHLRRNAARRGEESISGLGDSETEGGIDVVAHRQLAGKVLSRFDQKTQSVALGVLVGGMEHEEVAALLGISSNTVSRKLQRFVVNSRKYLRRTEEKAGDQPELVRNSG